MKLLFSLTLVLFSISASFAQKLEPVKWSFEAEKMEENEYKVIFKANVDKNWAIYSQSTPQGGPIPTSFHFLQNRNIALIGNVIETENVESKYDDMFGMQVIKIKGNSEFYQIVKTADPNTILEGFLTFMCCDDTKCLPPENVSFEIPLR